MSISFSNLPICFYKICQFVNLSICSSNLSIWQFVNLFLLSICFSNLSEKTFDPTFLGVGTTRF